MINSNVIFLYFYEKQSILDLTILENKIDNISEINK
jgi:hypothetical protein